MRHILFDCSNPCMSAVMNDNCYSTSNTQPRDKLPGLYMLSKLVVGSHYRYYYTNNIQHQCMMLESYMSNKLAVDWNYRCYYTNNNLQRYMLPVLYTMNM